MSFAVANTVLGTPPQQREAQPPIPAQRSADVLRRSTHHGTKRRPPRHRLRWRNPDPRNPATGRHPATRQSSPGTGGRAALALVLTDRERVLIGTGAAVTLAGVIVLAIFVGMNDSGVSTVGLNAPLRTRTHRGSDRRTGARALGRHPPDRKTPSCAVPALRTGWCAVDVAAPHDDPAVLLPSDSGRSFTCSPLIGQQIVTSLSGVPGR